jgi:hypothetical protein
MSFPMRPTSKPVIRVLAPSVVGTKLEIFIFRDISIRTSEVCCRFRIQADFLQHNFRTIIKQSRGENFQDWSILFENIASLPFPPRAKILSFHQTALIGEDTAQPVNLPFGEVIELSFRLLLNYILNIIV